MKKISLFGIISLLFAMGLSGCTGIRNQYQEKKTYQVRPAPRIPASEKGAGLLVKRFEISPEFETTAFVYRLSKTQFGTDHYNHFMVPPARMFTESIRENLYASPLFSPVFPHSLSDIKFRVWGKILDLYGDIQNKNQPMAIISIRLVLEKNLDNRFVQVINKTYSEKITLRKADPKELANGLSTGLELITTAFFKDIATQIKKDIQ